MGRSKENSENNSDSDKRIAELERVVKALLKGMVDLEKEQEEVYMPEGTYYGVEFKD